MLTTILLCAAPALSPAPLPPASLGDEAISVLVVSGANNHHWEWTTPSLVRILQESGQFDVQVTYDPGKDLADSEALGQYSAIVLDYNGQRWGDAAEAAFLTAVKNGLGVVIVHAADNHGRGWVEYEKLVGDLWRKGTGHGRFHPFNVEMTDRDHPVTRSLPDLILHPDELYHRLVNVHGVERRVLATAFSDPETGGVGTAEPMIIVKSYGKGRVFHTPLGHVWVNSPAQEASHRDPQFRGLIARGTEWAATGTVRDQVTAPKPLTPEEQQAGWVSLTERDSWQSFGGSAVPAGWAFDGDTIRREARSGDIVTKDLYDDFELVFDWKTSVAGNSGLKYRVPADAKSPIGPEFQLLDASGEAARDEHRMGALYDVIDAAPAPSTPWGEYRSARIVVRGTSIEHYLDGTLVASADVSSAPWKAALKDSKFAGRESFAQPGAGRILLQDHGDEVWIRGMRIRRLDSQGADSLSRGEDSDGSESLLPPEGSLAGWRPYGDAIYRVEGDTLVGSAGPARKQSFLISEKVYGDFELEVDLQIEVEGNSGIQLRSHILENERFAGYQAEIDPTPRSWSAGIFDEGRRGWINDLSDNEPARQAFDKTGWNHYRIRAEGPRIQTWVNGVPAADLLDGVDLSGHFGWQVHGGDDDIQIRWKMPRLKQLGMHSWVEASMSTRVENAVEFGEAPGVRMRVLGDDAMAVLHYADGTTKSVVLRDSKYWRKTGNNRVTGLRAGARTVIQVGDRTVFDQTVKEAQALEIRTSGARIEVSEGERCVK